MSSEEEEIDETLEKVKNLQLMIQKNSILLNLDQVSVNTEKIKNSDELLYNLKNTFKHLIILPPEEYEEILEDCLEILSHKSKLLIILKGHGINTRVLLSLMTDVVKKLKKELA